MCHQIADCLELCHFQSFSLNSPKLDTLWRNSVEITKDVFINCSTSCPFKYKRFRCCGAFSSPPRRLMPYVLVYSVVSQPSLRGSVFLLFHQYKGDLLTVYRVPFHRRGTWFCITISIENFPVAVIDLFCAIMSHRLYLQSSYLCRTFVNRSYSKQSS